MADTASAESLEAMSGKVYKPFKCPNCEKGFTRLTYVQRHQRLAHLGQRDHVCTKCEAAFARSDVLARHMTTCGNSKPRKRRSVPTEPKVEADEIPVTAPFGFQADGTRPFERSSFQSDSTGPLAHKSSSTSTSSNDNSPLFDYRASDGSPSSELATSPDSIPLFGDFSQGKSMADPMFGFTTSASFATPDALTLPAGVSQGYPFESQSSGGYDPFAPLAPSGFDASSAALMRPMSPSALLSSSGTYPSFLDLIAASSVHSPSPYTFRSPDYQFLPNEFVNLGPLPSFEIDPRFKLGPERSEWLLDMVKTKGMAWPDPTQMEGLVSTAAQSFLSFTPIVHLPTFSLNSEDLIFGFALATAGAAKPGTEGASLPGAQNMLSHALEHKRDFYIKEFSKRTGNIGKPAAPSFGGNTPCDKAGGTEDEKLAGIIRAFLVYQTIGFSHADKAQCRASASYHGALVNMLRTYGLLKRATDDSARLATANLPGRPLETMDPKTLDTHWRAVMTAETLVRSAWMIWLLDLALAGVFPDLVVSSVTFAEFASFRLPLGETLWSAGTASEWALMDAIGGGFTPPTLGAALRTAFGAPAVPPLVSLGAFAGAVLRRTLHFLVCRLNAAPAALNGEEVDPAVAGLWAELGLANPPTSRQGALARLAAAQAVVDRSCPMFDNAGNAPGSCSLTCIDEGFE